MKPPYPVFPIVLGKRVLLREIQLEDLNDIIDISFYDGVQASTLEEAIAMNNEIILDYNQGSSVHWGIIDIASNKIVGTCGYYRGFENESGELGCILLSEFRGKGFMTDAMNLAIDFGRKELGLKRIWAITSNENKKAKKLLERLGFTKMMELGDEVKYEL